jgi:hypothetical protein
MEEGRPSLPVWVLLVLSLLLWLGLAGAVGALVYYFG